MADYTYLFENNEFVIYDGDKKLCNPDNAIISTDNEVLTKKLIEALECGEDYTCPGSLLCYHYTYCNLRHHSIEEFVKEFCSYMTYDAFLWDKYLMFRQGAPVKQAIAGAFSGLYSSKIKTFNKYQFIAILVIHTFYHSWMLSYRIIADILENLEGNKYEEIKDRFMEELDEYERIEMHDHDIEIDEERYARYQTELSGTIDTFVLYFTLQ
jgi:hypothetical protein